MSSSSPAFAPRHEVHIQYPATTVVGKFNIKKEDLVLLPVDSAAYRFEPLPPIEDKHVMIYYGRSGDEDDMLSFMTDVTFTGNSTEFSSRYSAIKCNNPRVVEKMALPASCVGQTIIGAITYMKASESEGGPPRALISIISKTTLNWPSGTGATQLVFTNLWTMSIERFEVIQTDPGQKWLSTLQDALRRRTDMTARHVSARLRRCNVQDIPITWMRKRRALFTVSVVGRQTPTPGSEEDMRYAC
jgi:hypothetical protein